MFFLIQLLDKTSFGQQMLLITLRPQKETSVPSNRAEHKEWTAQISLGSVCKEQHLGEGFLGIQSRAPHLFGKCPITEPHPQQEHHSLWARLAGTALKCYSVNKGTYFLRSSIPRSWSSEVSQSFSLPKLTESLQMAHLWVSFDPSSVSFSVVYLLFPSNENNVLLGSSVLEVRLVEPT
jgi:hypothetical protein